MGKYQYILLSNDSGERLSLQDAPDGWDQTKINVIKDMTYFGVFKTLSVEFNFVGDGFKFLQSQRLRYGGDADVLFRLYGNGEFIFEGKVNYENYKEDRRYRKFQVDIIQSAFVESFQNFESVKFNILNNLSTKRKQINPADVKIATIRDRVLQRYSEFDGAIYGNEPQIYHHTLPFLIKVNDNPTVQNINNIEVGHEIETLYHRENAIFENRSPLTQTLNIEWDINYTMTYTGPLTLPHRLSESVPHGAPPRYHAVKNVIRFLRMNADNTIDTILYQKVINGNDIYTNEVPTIGGGASSLFPSGTYMDSFQGAVTVGPDQYIMFTNERYVNIWYGGDAYRDFPMGIGPAMDPEVDGAAPMTEFKVETVYNEMHMTILQNSTYPDTKAPVILPHELFTNLIAQMTGLDNAVYSPLFGREDLGYEEDGEFAYLAITKGDLLRGVPLEETQVSTSMRDAYKSYNILNLACVIENNNRIRIDRKDAMFNRNLIADLGEVSDLVISPAKDFIFNSVIVGYPKTEYEEDNGRDEFNTEVQYTNSFRAVKKELDIRSIYRADGRGIEEARRLQISETGTKDSRYDDKIFFIDLVKTSGGELMSRRLEGINYVGGIINPTTVMNARISPGQIMLMWQRYLAIPLHRKIPVYFFQSKDKNSGFQVTTPLGQSNDGEDLNLNDPAYFLPEMHDFQAPIRLSVLADILNNPFGIVKFTYEKETFYDFLFEVDAEVENKGGRWKMLGTKPTPVDVAEDPEVFDALKYGDGIEDFVKYGDGPNDIILYQ